MAGQIVFPSESFIGVRALREWTLVLFKRVQHRMAANLVSGQILSQTKRAVPGAVLDIAHEALIVNGPVVPATDCQFITRKRAGQKVSLQLMALFKDFATERTWVTKSTVLSAAQSGIGAVLLAGARRADDRLFLFWRRTGRENRRVQGRLNVIRERNR